MSLLQHFLEVSQEVSRTQFPPLRPRAQGGSRENTEPSSPGSSSEPALNPPAPSGNGRSQKRVGCHRDTSHKWQENYHLHTVNKASLHSASERQPRRGFSSQDSNKASSQTSKQVGKPIQVTEGPMWSRAVSSVPQLMASKFLDNRTKKQKEVASSGPKCFPIVSLKDKCGFSKIS